MKPAHVACAAAVLSFAALVADPAAAQAGKADPQGKDELWDVTSKMEMAGMPFAMPAQTRRVCAAKGNDAAMIPRNEGCSVVEAKRVGNKLDYRMNCRSGQNDYTATGESTWSGSGYEGRMRMVGKMDGQPMDMTMTYTGARAGNCTAAN